MIDMEDKLVELIKKTGMLEIEDCLYVAEQLYANGVTVKEPQKPLTVEEAAGTNEPVWYEYYKHPIAIPADVVYSHSVPFLEVHKLGSPSVLSMREDAYGKTWRCWAEKPTEAERKNAKWEE